MCVNRRISSAIWPSSNLHKKDMKPFHIDCKLECPTLFKDVLSCLRLPYSILEHPNTVLERTDIKNLPPFMVYVPVSQELGPIFQVNPRDMRSY